MAAAVSADGRRIAAGGAIAGKGAVQIWDATSGTQVWSANDHASEVLAVAFAPDGATLASGSADGVVRIRDAKTGHVTQTLSDHVGGATALAFSPDGNTLFCAQAFGGTRVWDARSGRLLQTLHVADSRPASYTVDRRTNSIGLSADGSILAACASSMNDEFVDTVRLWDARSGKLTRDFSAEDVHGQPMALSPDGSLIATGGKSVKLWDAHTGKLVRELYGYLKRTQSITFSADGKLLVSGGSYGTTNLWEVATGRLMATLFAPTDPQTGAVTDDWAACTPDGYYDSSPGAQRFLAWRVGDELLTPQALAPTLHQPQKVAAALVAESAKAPSR
jgi:WD40 repeat protein